MASPKNKKTKESNGAKTPAEASGAPAEKPKGKGCLTCGIIAAVVAVLIIIGIIGISILSFWFPPTALFGFLSQFKAMKSIMDSSGSSQKGTLKGKNLTSLIDPSKTVTKRISAKNGGRITVQTANGLYFTVNIGPGSLEEDTDIFLTPIDESPIENYPDPFDPGVVIGPPGTNLGNGSTVTVSEDPPAPEPGNPGADPGTPPDAPPGTSGDIPSFEDLSGLLGGNTMTTTPPGTSPGQGGGTTGNTGASRSSRGAGGSPSRAEGSSSRIPNTSVIIFTGYGGGVSTVPIEYSDDDDSITGPIDETGGTSADDPDEEESEDLADNAAANSGGACSPEFMQTMANASQAGGAGSSAAQAAIRDCLNTEWLNNLCVNDPVKLRRTHFEQRLAIARRFDAEAASVIESLMNQCQARYHFYGGEYHPMSNGDVNMFTSLDATVCGYLDDEWTGTQVYRLETNAYGTGQNVQATPRFRLPPNAGPFSGHSSASGGTTVVGRGVNMPPFELSFTGYFDGNATIANLELYPGTFTGIPIDLREKPCVPLAPLPGSSGL